MESTSRIGSDWDSYCEYSAYSSSPGWREPSPPTQNRQDSEAEDPDGVPLVMDQYGPELSRKRKELQEIEDRIIHKKAAIAIKTVGFFKSPGVSSDMCKGETLRDRVENILQQRPFSIYSKVQSSKERIKPSIQSRDGSMQDHHPLKLRVAALLKQRRGETCVFPPNGEKAPDVAPDVLLSPPSRSFTSPSNEEKNKGFERFISLLNKGVVTNLKDTVPDVPQAPRPSQSVTSPAKEDNVANKGFERFLKLLNKKEHAKVPDVSLSSPRRSVTSPAKEERSVDRGFERFLSVLNKGVDINLLSRIVNDDGEDLPHPPGVKSKSDPPLRSESQRSDGTVSLPGCGRTGGAESKTLSRERSLPDAKERTTDQRGGGVGSGSQSESLGGKEKEKEEEDTPKLDEKQEQLQNILKTLGLSLGVDEMNKLTDRTQERLYGKKTDGRQRPDSREEKESRPHSRSSSSSSSYSSCSSTSRSTSRSRSRSPSHRRRSRSRDSEHKQKCERSRSREGSRDGPTHHDRKEASNDAPGHGYRDSAFPDYSLYQYSHHAASHSDPCWSYAPPSASTNLNSYPQPASEGPEAAHKRSHIFSLINPDLSVSEGQSGLAPGSRCLKVVATEQPSQRHLRPLTKVRRRRGGQRHLQQKRRKERKRAKRLVQKQMEYAAQRERMLASLDNEDSTEEEEKPQPTEEEVKANLRKKLQAFNQKAKHAKQLHNPNAMQPDNSLTLELS